MSDTQRRLLLLHPNPAADAVSLASLRREGHQLTLVCQLPQMVRELRFCCFDCVLIDSECLEAEQAIEITGVVDPEAPIIVTVHDNSWDKEIRLRRQRIYYYHLKEFGVQELLQAIVQTRRRIPPIQPEVSMSRRFL